jgi:hypothetical protein
MKLDIIWRIGDGRDIKIWSDPWIPRGTLRRPTTTRRGNILTYVADLIDPASGSWDVELVKDVFWEEDADIILALPVHEGRDNFLAWHFNEHGIFCVKSAYKICRDDLLRKKDKGSLQEGAKVKLIQSGRRSNCPNKVKHFIWRFAHNSHPLRKNLERRGMKLDTKCL